MPPFPLEMWDLHGDGLMQDFGKKQISRRVLTAPAM
jgi:hypothetical protein